MSLKVYQLYCEICNWKSVTDGTEVEDKLYEYSTSPIPGGAPYVDPVDKKTVEKKSQKQPRKFRCPKCGRVVIPRQIDNPQEDVDLKNELKNRKTHEEDWAIGRKERSQGSEVSGEATGGTDSGHSEVSE